MTGNDEGHRDYEDDETSRLESIWGEGFLSPGGPAEVSRMLGGHTIDGLEMLDIGSGTGGVDIVLAREHGAGAVTGIDVEKELVDLATDRLAGHGLEDRIRYQLVEAGPLPFPDESFDAVFSKDSILQVQDKHELYAEVFRVMRPGGRLFVSDWLRGEGVRFDETVQRLVAESGHDFAMVSLGEVGELLGKLGFAEIDLTDRRDWYLNEATAELEIIRGPQRSELQDELEFWEIMVVALKEGALMPGHIRAMKPADFQRE